MTDVFLPLMEADAFAVYAYLKRQEFTNPNLRHSIREVGPSINRSPSTVSRALEILEHLRLAELTRFGGSKESECKLLDSKESALGLGAIYHSKTISWFLPNATAKRLQDEIRAIRQRQQGKTPNAASPRVRNHSLHVSLGNASVSPAIRQRSARETQTGTHLIQEERRSEEGPTPTPSHERETQKAKSLSDEDEPDLSPTDWATKAALSVRRWAEIPFTGVMNDLGSHLLDSSRPPVPHLANGADDWNKYGLGSLAVCAAAWRGGVLVLTLSASDPEAARCGLKKYHRTFDASLRAWYGCEVKIVLVKPNRQRCCDS